MSRCTVWSIDWAAATNFKRSDGGRSSGVYFVALPGDEVVVVKPDDDVVADYAGFLIAEQCGVPQPMMRVVRLDSAEGGLIHATLRRIEHEKPLKDRCQPPVDQILSGLPCVLVMEFVKGASLKARRSVLGGSGARPAVVTHPRPHRLCDPPLPVMSPMFTTSGTRNGAPGRPRGRRCLLCARVRPAR